MKTKAGKYRIKKVKTFKSEKYYPQKKGIFGWHNVHYDMSFETYEYAKLFLDDYTTPDEKKIEIFEYDNPKAVNRLDLGSSFLRIFMADHE